MRQHLKKIRLLRVGHETRTFILTIVGFILSFSLIGVFAWFGPDSSSVIRSSSAKVPDLTRLSKEDAVAELGKLATSQSYDAEEVTVEFLEDDALKIFRKSSKSDYETTTIVPLSQLDTFLYAQQQPKGKRIWDIKVFCANYQPCITGSTNRSASEFTLNTDILFWIESSGDIPRIIALLNRLLELHNAKSTIDTSKNTIRISEEHWQRQIEDDASKEAL